MDAPKNIFFLKTIRFKETLIFAALAVLLTLVNDSFAFNPFLLVLIFLSYNRGINIYLNVVSFNLITAFIMSLPYGLEMVIINAIFFFFCILMSIFKLSYEVKKYGPFFFTYLVLISFSLIRLFSILLLINLLLSFIVSCSLLFAYNNFFKAIVDNNNEFDSRAKIIVLSSVSLIFYGISGFYLLIARLIHIIICKTTSSVEGALSIVINCFILFYLQNISYNLLLSLLIPALLGSFINKKYVTLTYLISYVFINVYFMNDFYKSIIFYQGIVSIAISLLIPLKLYNYFEYLFARADDKNYLDALNNLHQSSEEIDNIIKYIDMVLDTTIKYDYSPEDKIITAIKKKICIECVNKGECRLYPLIKKSLNEKMSAEERMELFDYCLFPYKIINQVRVSKNSLQNEKKLIEEIKNKNDAYQKEIKQIYLPLRNVFYRSSLVTRKKTIILEELEKKNYQINCLSISKKQMTFEVVLNNKDDIFNLINEINSITEESFYLIDMFFVLSLGVYHVELSSEALYSVDSKVISQGVSEGINGDSSLIINENGHFLLLLSDGVGHAQDSAYLSLFLINSLNVYRKIERDINAQINNINTLLKSKVDEERYATLDYIDINLVNADMTMYKCGSFNSYLYRDSVLYKFKSSSPPIGILYHISTSPLEKQLIDGDILIIMSDGYGENIESIIENTLKNNSHNNPNELCTLINDQLIQRQEVIDDKTLVVLKIKALNQALVTKNVGISLKKI